MRSMCVVLVPLLVACSKTNTHDSAGASAPSVQSATATIGLSLCSPNAYDALLQKYVKEGRVDYAALKTNAADMRQLDDYLGRIGRCDAGKLAPKDHYAFWVNAYNAFNIKGVLDNWPIKDIKSVSGFLDKHRYRVANKDLTINDMEYKQLIPVHQDARAHFVVVCADLGSVPIAPHAYSAKNLDDMLEKKAHEFARDSRNFRVDLEAKKVFVSKLFAPDWYEKDFLSDKRFNGKKAVEYLIPYVAEEVAQFLRSGDYSVEYIDWDWTLNAAQVSNP